TFPRTSKRSSCVAWTRIRGAGFPTCRAWKRPWQVAKPDVHGTKKSRPPGGAATRKQPKPRATVGQAARLLVAGKRELLELHGKRLRGGADRRDPHLHLRG